MTADEARADLAIAALAWGATRDDKRLLAAIDHYHAATLPALVDAVLADRAPYAVDTPDGTYVCTGAAEAIMVGLDHAHGHVVSIEHLDGGAA